jgi:hypothetical protein
MTKQSEANPQPSALALIEQSYPALIPETRESVMLAMRQNLGEAQVTPMDLNRIKSPSGGSLFFTVEDEPLKEVTGIIIHQRDQRAYWRLSMEEGGSGNPPDCFSLDCKTGTGDPGGACHLCPFSKFEGDEPPTCKQMRLLFLLRPGCYLPDLVQVPPSSLKNAAQYMLSLASKALPYFAVETTIGLEKAKSRDGIDYGKFTFKAARVLPKEKLTDLVGFAQSLKDVFAHVPVVDPVA